MDYTELQVTSNFSFLRGASHPEELVEHAAMLGHTAIAITDHNTLAGIVRAHAAAKKKGIRIIVGCRLDLQDGPSLLAYPTSKAGYAALSNLLTLGNSRTEKGKCELYKQDIYAAQEGMLFIALPPSTLDQQFGLGAGFIRALKEHAQYLRGRLYLGAARYYHGSDAKYLYQLDRLSEEMQVPLVATNDVHYHSPQRRQLQDILTCIREKCTIHTAGFRLHANAERYLKPVAEMQRLFRQYPTALARAQEIAAACTFSLDELQYEYPEEITTRDMPQLEELELLAWEGARRLFGDIPEKIANGIQHEMRFIREMDYAAYFLTVYDIVRFARGQGILCQGRGSAANSTICYCLGITSVDPTKFDLLFERFISAARNEPPDIDVDFEHERREEVMQYIYAKYGRDRAAIVATVTHVHQKGAIRDVGRAMGLSVDTIHRLSGSVWEFTQEFFAGKSMQEQGLNPNDRHLRKVLELTGQYMGFPRQLGQHTGGFVITRGKLSDLVPILNARMVDRTCIEWNKDDIDALGFMKVDVLSLGMLTCIRKAFELAKLHYGVDLHLHNIPQDDPAVYDMICRAHTIGVFQIESRAQQSMLPRLRPRCFYDLVIEVAIVRPGPIQGDMVHPYLRRRNGKEAVEYPSKELEDILKRTLGVPLFQEQAMKIAIVAAGFTPAEADELRRSMATFKLKGLVSQFQRKLVHGMVSRGYTEDYAMRVFRQLEGFGSYGFPESHAASFASLVYASSWLKCHYPDVFTAALLNSMPMGFYAPAQIVADLQKDGVQIRPVDINHSHWDNILEERQQGKHHVVRLGFRQVDGLRKEDMDRLVSERSAPYTTVDSLRDAGMPDAAMVKLADADAFRSIGLDRRQALWETSKRDRPTAMYAGQSNESPLEKQIKLPLMAESEHVVQDYAATSLSLRAHPVSFLRTTLDRFGIIPTGHLAKGNNGEIIRVAGLVTVRQRPGTAKGTIFMTIEDETGNANLVIFGSIFELYRKQILQSKLVMVEGQLQIEGEVVHVIVRAVHNYSKLLLQLTASQQQELSMTMSRADETSLPTHVQQERHKKAIAAIPGSRDFK